MKREIKTLKNGILSILFLGEKWYAKPLDNVGFEYYPSITYILNSYPKGIFFLRWLAAQGTDNVERIQEESSARGSKVHQAIYDLDCSKEVKYDSKYINTSTNQSEELSVEEYEAIMSYKTFHENHKPLIFANELTVFGDGYAGTIDKIARIGDQVYIIDIKTGQNIWEEHILQISAYSHSNVDFLSLGITKEEWDNRKLAILQVGYKRNKRGYKFTEVPDKYDIFLATKKIWENENPDTKPFQKDYPVSIKLGV